MEVVAGNFPFLEGIINYGNKYIFHHMRSIAIIFSLLTLTLTVSDAVAAGPTGGSANKELEARKAKIVARLQRRIQETQALQACVQGAESYDAVNECRRASLEASGERHEHPRSRERSF
jgi:hypothetical protein